MNRIWLLPLLLLVMSWRQTPPPGFKAHVTLVEVDVVVSDGAGRPVSGLRREDFTIAEDGNPVEVATFRAVHLPVSAPSIAPTRINPRRHSRRTNRPTTGGCC